VGDYDLPDKDTEFQKPKEIVDKMIAAQQKLLTGFKGDERTDLVKWNDAQHPKHAAISLSGEPLLYPYLSELVQEFHDRGLTTFIVTNGVHPDALQKLDPLPTQLYVTLVAPDKETYFRTTRSRLKDGWERLVKTVTEILPELETRKVLRLTLVKDLNMHSPERYAELIEKSRTHFVECKAYMAVGCSTDRLPYEAMPSHDEIREFAKNICSSINWKIIDEQEASRVVLIAKKDYEWRKHIEKNSYEQ